MTDFDQKMEIFQNSKIKKQQETQIAKLTNQQIRKHQARSVNQAELEPMIKIIEQQSELIKQQAQMQQPTLLQQAQEMQQQAQQMQQQGQMQQASILQQLQQTQLSRKR